MAHQVGAGVHGPVFLATDPEGDRQVAIKTFPLDITPERAAELSAVLRQLVSTPLAHPSIVRLLDAGSEGSTVYLVQEYVLAESVDAAVREYGPAPIPDALRLIGQLAGAIDFAAVAGVHHGALHPRDVLVAPNDVRLTGLGIAGAFEQVGLRVAARRPYSAPERHDRRSWGTPADVFSLAAVGFEMLTGRRPGSAEAIAADTRSLPSPDPAALAEVFARALSARPSDRFQTALAFAASLRHALTGEPIDRPDGIVERAPEAAVAAVPAIGPDAPTIEEPSPAPVLADAPPPAALADEPPAVVVDELPAAVVADEPPAVVVADEVLASPPVDDFRLAEVEEATPTGPLELGEEPAPPPDDTPRLPLEVAAPPPAQPARPALAPDPLAAPLGPRFERGAPGRTRFPLSSLLAMLLLGIVAGFIGGYLVGRGESGAGPVGQADVPPAAPIVAEPIAAEPIAAEPRAAEPRAAVPEATAPPRVSAPAPARPAPRGAQPAPAGAARRTAPPAAEQDDEPDRPFEAPLSVISRPAGALVRLDGRAVGKTPLQLSAIRAGAHVVRLELNGYLPWTSAIQVVSGAQNRVTASLERRPGGSE